MERQFDSSSSFALACIPATTRSGYCLAPETKVANDAFPLMEIESAGYRTILHGQQNYNGVAILIHDPTRWSNLRAFSADATQRQDTETPPLGEPWGIRREFPDNPVSEETRVVSACVGGLRFVNVYVVNGAPRSSDSFAIKRRWMARLGDWLHSLPPEPPLIVVGDFNVAPDDRDVWDPEGLQDRIHCTDEERRWLQNLQGKRLRDLLRASTEKTNVYTWWPYQDGAFERDEGLHFDLALGDEKLVQTVQRVWVDRKERHPSGGDEPLVITHLLSLISRHPGRKIELTMCRHGDNCQKAYSGLF